MKFPKPSDNVCYPIGYEKYLAMQKYEELKKQVLDKLKCKRGFFDSIIAVKIVTEDDFKLLKEYCVSAFTSCGDNDIAKVDGEYQGEDWYFIESIDNPCGIDVNGFKCHLKTLAEKKNAFSAFLSEFEEGVKNNEL